MKELYEYDKPEQDKQYSIGRNALVFGLIISLCVFAIFYFVGRSDGKNKEKIKQAETEYRNVGKEIDRLQEVKKQDAVYTSTKSKEAVKQAEKVRNSVPKAPPVIKDVETREQYEYLKNVKP